MKKLFILIVILSIIISCSDKREKEYYKSGNLKSEKYYGENNKIIKTLVYYDLNDTIRKSIYYHKINYDSIVHYFSNGKISSTGIQDNYNRKYGKWDYYHSEGFRNNTREFYNIKGKEIVNQLWFYNKKGDTLFGAYTSNPKDIIERAVFARFDYYSDGDTLSIAEPLRCIVEQRLPLFMKYNSECYIVLAKEKYNFNKDFSNEAKVKLDTFYCAEKDKVNKKTLLEAGYNPRYTVAFGTWFDTPGNKILRGYLVEKYKRKPTPTDSVIAREGRIYFEKRIYVKDTIAKKKNGL